MKMLRRILGVLVMIAGVLGLVLSLAGIVSVWLIKPRVTQSLDSTIVSLTNIVETSQNAMVVTEQALSGTISSVQALQTMLSSTAITVQNTDPLISTVTGFMGDQLPKTVAAASDSLKSAQQAAGVIDSAIKSLNNFQTALSGVPLLGNLITLPPNDLKYNPDKPLAESLGEIVTQMQDLPQKLTDMSQNLDKATSNFSEIQTSLTTMSTNIGGISTSLEQYKSMIATSQTSMGNLKSILTNLQANLHRYLNIAAIVMTLFLLWLLAAQVVIFSQGWELFHGTTDRIE